MSGSRSKKRMPRLFARAGTAAVALATVGNAPAEPWLIEPYVHSSITATSNANFNRQDQARSDVITEASPGIRALGHGAQWTVDAAIGLQGVAYLDGSQQNKVLPDGHLNVGAELVKDWFFIDTGGSLAQQTEDAFGARPTGPSTYNRFTVAQYRFSPYLDHDFGRGVQLLVRSDNGWTDTIDAPARTSDGYYGLHTVRLSRKPEPLGGALEYERTQTQFTGQSQDAFVEETARAIASVALGPSLTVSAIGGVDHYEVPFFDDRQSLYGGRVNWHPSERTTFDATVERRFFGTGWDLKAQYKLPTVAFDLRWNHDVTTTPETVFSLPATGNVASVIDQLLSASVRDPIARDKAVRDFMAQRGLPDALPGAVNIYSQRATLTNAINGTVTFIGARNTLAVNVFRARTEALRTQDDVPFQFNPLEDNNEQIGLAARFSRRLTPIMQLNVTALRFDTKGLGQNSDTKTHQTSLVAELNRQFTPRASWQAGLRWQRIDSNIANDATERAAYVGLLYRF